MTEEKPPQRVSEDIELQKIRLEKKLSAKAAELADARTAAAARVAHMNALAVQSEKGRIDQEAAATASARSTEKDLRDSGEKTEQELTVLFHTAIAEVAKGAIDRARDSAKFVQTAATAIFALYSALLALAFSVTDNPLPLRGAWAGVFLGLSVALASAYLAFLGKADKLPLKLPGGSRVQQQYARTAYIIQWVNQGAHNRRYAIRSSVISLLFGVAFIAAPFVSSGPTVDIPDTPSPPAIPNNVAPEVVDQAAKLFELQVNDFAAASTARKAALQLAQERAASFSAQEKRLNNLMAVLAALGLLMVLLGPLIYDVVGALLRKTRSSQAASTRGAANGAR